MSNHIMYTFCRVPIHEQLEQWRGGAPLAGQKTTTAAAGMNTKEVHAFSLMEVVLAVTMLKIRGVTMVTTFISPLNAELFHLQGG